MTTADGTHTIYPPLPPAAPLAEVARRHGTDKFEHGYCPHYERHLGDGFTFRGTLVEVGVAAGNSLRTWREFYPFAQVIGIEINVAYADVGVLLGDAATPEPWQQLSAVPDVIIDDGSHVASEILTTFAIGWQRLAPGGWYVIEDLETTRHGQFGGDSHTFGPVGALLDEMARLAIMGQVELHLYEEIAFIKKLR
jgi:hypothetical protein